VASSRLGMFQRGFSNFFEGVDSPSCLRASSLHGGLTSYSLVLLALSMAGLFPRWTPRVQEIGAFLLWTRRSTSLTRHVFCSHLFFFFFFFCHSRAQVSPLLCSFFGPFKSKHMYVRASFYSSLEWVFFLPLPLFC